MEEITSSIVQREIPANFTPAKPYKKIGGRDVIGKYEKQCGIGNDGFIKKGCHLCI